MIGPAQHSPPPLLPAAAAGGVGVPLTEMDLGDSDDVVASLTGLSPMPTLLLIDEED